MLEYAVIFMNKEHQIVRIDGDMEKVLGSSLSLQTGVHLYQIDWDRVLEDGAPSLAKGTHVSRLRSGDWVSFFTLDFPETSKKISYFIIITRLTAGFQGEDGMLAPGTLGQIPAKSESMKKIIDIIHRISEVDSTVLLLGETGVGKTRLARYIHEVSSRSKQPFITVNCGAIPDSLIESELFGYEPGAFTGGRSKGKKGLIESADGGILFLDEIAELPFSVQSKLLEVLQEHTFRKVGGTKSIKVDIRIIAATNKDLQQMVLDKTFREDLYYRLHVVPLTIPPLRERREEIIPLAEHFVQKFNKQYGRQFSLSSQAKARLLEDPWRGNIRELENTIERMVVTQSEELGQSEDHPPFEAAEQLPPLKEAKRKLEKDLILRAYERYGTTYKAAEVLQVDQSTIAKKVKQYREEERLKP
ncbi:sigma-54 interaction domain-containing protein [Siminovitchia sediminis]|uniref:HTH-type transcriptional regulatory protein TyrR n=1 Tax=Siminovitchia sediminis TaxID=1274353 RepID=A0ABW4KG94_9BACI